MKVTFLEHIKEYFKKVKEDTTNRISELATKTVEAIEEIEAQKADTSHKHGAGDINSGTLPVDRGGTGATTAANARTNLGITPANIGAAASSHGTHVTFSTTTPVMDGTAAVGTATTVSRSDHKHPTDTSRAAASHTHNYAGSSSAGGAATSAIKLQTARTIDGMNFNGSVNITHFGVCSTAANVAAKTVALSGFVLTEGARVAVFFTNTNTASNLTLNINSTGAKAISCTKGTYAPTGQWEANQIVEFVYYSSHWIMITANARRLYTARSIRTNLGSTSSASFDGTASITPGVTGTLPIANGGTGATSASAALSKLGGFPKSGGTINGDIVVQGNIMQSSRSVASTNLLKIKIATPSTNTIAFDTSYENHKTNFNKLTIGMKIIVQPILIGFTNEFTIKSIDTTNNSVVVNEKIETNYRGSMQRYILLPVAGENNIFCYAEGEDTTAGYSGAHAEGNATSADAFCAHAEGCQSQAFGQLSHAEGSSSKALGYSSHAEGGSEALGDSSHAEGSSTKAEGDYSHAEGRGTIAKGMYSHAGGFETRASANYQTAIGKYNKESTTETDKFIIGNGTSSARSNCLRVTNANGVYSNSTYKSSGADYAELFQWLDDNSEKEDRVGLFVTLVGERIRIAKPIDKHILGIVSGCPSVLGDVYDDQWKGMYEIDIYGRPILENVEVPAETIEIPDPENPEQTITKVIQEAHTEIRQKLNPNYDPTQEYIPRSERPEWDAVGMMGKLVVIDDGTCEVDGYCTVGEGGIATKAEQETKFYVMARVDKNHIRVMIW